MKLLAQGPDRSTPDKSLESFDCVMCGGSGKCFSGKGKAGCDKGRGCGWVEAD